MIVGNLVAGKRIAQASGRELAHLEDSDQARKVTAVPGSARWAPGSGRGLRGLSAQFLFLPDVLQWRAHTTPDHPLFLLLNAKVRPTCCPSWLFPALCARAPTPRTTAPRCPPPGEPGCP